MQPFILVVLAVLLVAVVVEAALGNLVLERHLPLVVLAVLAV
jgi:hypothetical protein